MSAEIAEGVMTMLLFEKNGIGTQHSYLQAIPAVLLLTGLRSRLKHYLSGLDALKKQ